MRSRYSAYVMQERAYLLRTWSSAHRPRELVFDQRLRWTGLQILARTGGSAFHTTGTVEFVARFERDGAPGQQHENSAFVREHGDWVYQRSVESVRPSGH
jgi:SEC-C motif-containing protein